MSKHQDTLIDRFITYSTFDMLNFLSLLSWKQTDISLAFPFSILFIPLNSLHPSPHSFAILLRALIHPYLCSLFHSFVNLPRSPTARCIQQIRFLALAVLTVSQRLRLITSRLGLNC